jgi:hypothetical protein
MDDQCDSVLRASSDRAQARHPASTQGCEKADLCNEALVRLSVGLGGLDELQCRLTAVVVHSQPNRGIAALPKGTLQCPGSEPIALVI